MTRTLAVLLWNFSLVPSALAQEGNEGEVCLPGDVCGQAAVLGSWGLIVLGLLFCLVALLPYRGQGEAGEGRSLSLLRMLQVRIEKETTGWRRLQWPLLGLLFIGLGAATLLGWR